MVVTIEQHELQRMLVEAARLGANHAIEDLVCYHFNEACDRLGISYNTLKKRILERKIEAIDGRITGAEIRRYLSRCDVPIGCSPGRVWETGVLYASVTQETQPDEQP